MKRHHALVAIFVMFAWSIAILLAGLSPDDNGDTISWILGIMALILTGLGGFGVWFLLMEMVSAEE